MTNTGQLVNLRNIIEKKGSIPISEFMEIVLSSKEDGYYSKGDPIGANKDFITAPEISQLFGEIIGVFIASNMSALNLKKARIVELGPGKGTLMRDLLRSTKNISGFHESISVDFVDISKPLIAKQEKLRDIYPNIRFNWLKNVYDLKDEPTIIIANEYFDALPIRQFVKNKEFWDEVVVSLVPGKGDLRFSEMPLDKDYSDYLNFEYSNSSHRSYVELSEESVSQVKHLASHIEKNNGFGLLFDYGYFAEPNIRTSFNATLQAIKNHKYHPVLDDIGEADLTAHVDFFALSSSIITRENNVFGPVSQGDFLNRFGIELRASMLAKNASDREKEEIFSGLVRLTDRNQMGELFKVMAFTKKTNRDKFIF